jgi:hypothetical protein
MVRDRGSGLRNTDKVRQSKKKKTKTKDKDKDKD